MTQVLNSGYILGTTLTLYTRFKVGGVYTDPTTVKFTAKSPHGTLTTYVYPTDTEIVKESTGKYKIDFQPDKVGTWHYRFEGTGTAKGVSEGCIQIVKSCVVDSI